MTTLLSKNLPRIHVLSDLHLVGGDYAIPTDLDFDVLVAAGDIGRVPEAIAFLKSIGKPVVYVLGNHERYGDGLVSAVFKAKSLAAGSNVHILEKDYVDLHGVRFLGATMWTDYAELAPSLVATAAYRMNDFKEISAEDWLASAENRRELQELQNKHPNALRMAEGSTQFNPYIAYIEHKRATQWLCSAAISSPYPVVVVSHHAPSYRCLESLRIDEHLLKPENQHEGVWSRYRIRESDTIYFAAYASNLGGARLNAIKEKALLWAHGHIHAGHDILDEGLRIVCNPRGHGIKPLTMAQADAYRLFGLHFTEADVLKSQERHKLDPYGGDAVGFDPHFVVDTKELRHGVLVKELAADTARLRVLVESVKEYQGKDLQGPSVESRAMRRCFELDADEARSMVERIQLKVVRPISGLFLSRDSEAPRVASYQCAESPPAMALTVQQMEAAYAWVEALPGMEARQIEKVSRLMTWLGKHLKKKHGLQVVVPELSLAYPRDIYGRFFELYTDSDIGEERMEKIAATVLKESGYETFGATRFTIRPMSEFPEHRRPIALA